MIRPKNTMNSRKFEKMLKIICVVAVILAVLCLIGGWFYNKKFKVNENNGGESENVSLDGSGGENVGDDIFM